MSHSDPVEDKDALLKEAAVMLDTAQRREEATKLAFVMVELGKVPPYGTYADFQTKVASLMTKDLRVIEQALEMDVDLPDFGKVAAADDSHVPGFESATLSFFHALADD